MLKKRSLKLPPLLLTLALSLLSSQSIGDDYTINAVGESAHAVLRSIAEQAGKKMVLHTTDAEIAIDINAATAYSAVRQVVNNVGYKMHYLDDTFTISPVGASMQPPQKTHRPAATKAPEAAPTFSLTLRNTPIQEAFEMLAKRGRVNLMLAPDVSGTVSANLYDIDIDGAIRNVAKAAGLVVERNNQEIYVRNAGPVTTAALSRDKKELHSFKVQYTDVASVEGIMREYLSEDGTLTTIPDRKMVVVRDKPQVISELQHLLRKVDVQPRLIMIEAKILEITLTDEETYGIDWQSQRGDGEFGTLSLANRDTAGLFLNVVGNNLNAYLSALSKTGRVRTLSTPKLLVLEDQSAEVIVGDKLGFRVVSTNGTSTSESVEFLESGIILRVKASVDSEDRILMDVHPEVSTGQLTAGLPVQKTTEVTTNLLADSGDEIFIGGLLRRTSSDSDTGVPGLSNMPVVGGLFKKTENSGNRTETVVIIKPRIVNHTHDELEPMAELLESDSWFYQKLPKIEVVSGCVNSRCGY